LRRDFDIEHSPFKTYGDAAKASIQFGLDLLVAPLGERLLGSAKFGVLGDEPDDALQQLGAMGTSGRCVEILLDHHGGEARGAAEVVHQTLKQFA
jgi:hypothetical protein